jgi:hypothetical protein
VHPDAQPRHPPARPPHARRHPADDPLKPRSRRCTRAPGGLPDGRRGQLRLGERRALTRIFAFPFRLE